MFNMRSKLQQLEGRTECSYRLLEEAAAQYHKTHHALTKLEKEPVNARVFFEIWDTNCDEIENCNAKKLARKAQERRDLQIALDNDVEWVKWL
jgi:hypothetical protein